MNTGSLMLSTASGGTNTSCLVDAADASKTISLQMCGNGIVEAGEDCDPGQGVNSTCCNAATCKFTAGAVCDPASSPCCTGQCTFAPSSQVCRPSKDATCDQAEMCTGDSAVCPADVFSPNGIFYPFSLLGIEYSQVIQGKVVGRTDWHVLVGHVHRLTVRRVVGC